MAPNYHSGSKETMVEETIAEYIAAQTSFATGTDLFLNVLPKETREGIAVRVIRHIESDGDLHRAYIAVLIFYHEYPTARDHQDTLSELFDDKRGSLDGSWSVASEIDGENLGKDELDRQVLGINFIASYHD